MAAHPRKLLVLPKPQFFSFSKLLGSLPPPPHCSPAFPQHLLLPLPYGCSPLQASRDPKSIHKFSLSVQWPDPDPLAPMPLNLVNHFCSKSNLWEQACLPEPVELLQSSRASGTHLLHGLCCSWNRPYRPWALPGRPKGLEPPLEPFAERADDVFGSPLRCSGKSLGGRSRKLQLYSFLPSECLPTSNRFYPSCAT